MNNKILKFLNVFGNNYTEFANKYLYDTKRVKSKHNFSYYFYLKGFNDIFIFNYEHESSWYISLAKSSDALEFYKITKIDYTNLIHLCFCDFEDIKFSECTPLYVIREWHNPIQELILNGQTNTDG